LAPIAGFGSPGPVRKSLPLGIQVFSVRDQLSKDLNGTIRALAAMGFQLLEFFGPYYDWTPAQARDVRKLMDDLHIRCLSTHNTAEAYQPSGLPKTIELNRILGAKYIVMAQMNPITSLDGWKQIADLLATANQTLNQAGMHSAYHNHEREWSMVEGKLPLEVIASNTPADVMMQLDVGTCLHSGADPVAWVEKHPGRTKSMHLKDWSPEKGYKVIFGDSKTPWEKLLTAAETVGGAEYMLLEQEECDIPTMEAVKQSLAGYRKLRG
jgi:sugar phosphate isomerase/epimerase